MAILTHKRTALHFHELESHIHGIITLATSTATNAVHTQTTISTTNATGTGWGIMTQAYSYDGIIHFDSYISDI